MNPHPNVLGTDMLDEFNVDAFGVRLRGRYDGRGVQWAEFIEIQGVL
jgi:hypothetical protein